MLRLIVIQEEAFWALGTKPIRGLIPALKKILSERHDEGLCRLNVAAPASCPVHKKFPSE